MTTPPMGYSFLRLRALTLLESLFTRIERTEAGVDYDGAGVSLPGG